MPAQHVVQVVVILRLLVDALVADTQVLKSRDGVPRSIGNVKDI